MIISYSSKDHLSEFNRRLKTLEAKNFPNRRTEVKIEGKKGTIKKAYHSPDFKKKTVLTHDTWRYVDIFLHTKSQINSPYINKEHQKKARKYWEQARQFYLASKQLDEHASPLTLYYSFLNAAKALLFSKNQEFDSTYHGIVSDVNKDGISIFSEEMTLKNGVFCGLCKYFDENYCIGKKYSLKWILYNIPYIHRSFYLTYPNNGNLFIPILKPRFVFDRKEKKIWLEATLEKKYSKDRTLKKLQKFEKDPFYKGENFVILSKEKLGDCNSYSIKKNKNIYKKFLIYYRKIRKNLTYIHGPKDIWYIKRCDLKNCIPWNTIELTFAGMHKLSSLARYYPEKLEKYLTKTSHWLLSEFINLSADQFIDQIACEITGCSLKIPGIKYSE